MFRYLPKTFNLEIIFIVNLKEDLVGYIDFNYIEFTDI